MSSQDIMWALTPSTIVGSPMGFVTKTWQSKQYELTHTSLLNRPELFENMILRASPDGEVLRLRDVAEVEMVSSVYIPSVGAEVD